MADKDKLEKLKKLADTMYYAANYLTTDASRLHKAMEDYHQFIIHECKEEPVSNPIDFEKELYKAFGQVKDFTLGMRIAKWFYDMGKNSQEPVSEDWEEEIKRYLHKVYDRDTTVGDVARHFAKWKKEQMMKKAVDVTIAIPYQNGYGGYTQLLDSKEGLPFGEKVKVLVIKED